MSNEPRLLLNLREPIWVTQRGKEIPLSIVKNNHLRRIERWLRGQGKTQPARGEYAMWYNVIKAEMDKRRLEPLDA